MMKYSAEKMRLGMRISYLRNKAGLSQSKLAMAVGVHRPTINQIESGRANPQLETLARIAQGIGVEVEDLFKD